MNDLLKTRLHRVIRRQQWLQLSRQLAVCWIAAALVAAILMWIRQQTGWSSPFDFPLLGAVAVTASLALLIRSEHKKLSEQAIAKKIEEAYPDLRGLLFTAVQQLEVPEKQQSYLQYRVAQQALDHSQRTRSWRLAVPQSQVRFATLLQVATLVIFAVVLWEGGVASVKPASRRAPFFSGSGGITVTPGDTTVERGESLFVLARFGGSLPPGVDLVVNDAASPARKIPLVKSLADPMFGGSVPEVASDFTYHLDYAGEHTREYTVKVFEHPRLTRSDVDLKYPDYTHLAPKRVEDTRRVSAVEGTQLGLTLQLNKPVASAKLIARNKEKTEIPLTVVADKATASVSVLLGGGAGPLGPPSEDATKTQTGGPSGPSGPALPNIPASQTYELKLVDAEGRANKVATQFVIDVQPNRRPELKLTSPRGDVRPSAVEEISFEGTVWDDFGAPAYGIAYTVAGQETKFLELGNDVPSKEKRAFSHIVRLEELGVKPDDLVSWYAWADDLGPDGKLRRTGTDMYFAEVRPFDEVFREGQGAQPDDQQQGQQGQGNQARRLTDLEKQIINATWKLQRDPASPKYSEDATVVRESQDQALAMATAEQEQAFNPRQQALWGAALKPMQEALKHLATAQKSPKALDDALKAEQEAFQALLKLQARETEVARQRGRRGQGGQAGNQRQIDELDLTQSQNRYETQNQAKAPQSAQRQEQNQILNRLQELARRQQDVNERLKEMQTALQAARTEEEKAEILRQLKRLQEEQQQMLADLDETRQRMERPENQSAMQQQREQLDQTRQDLQRAADATGQGSVSQALASGTRAQRQLQQMRDELRKQNSSEFADDLRQMRSEARELAQQQADTEKKIQGLENSQRRTLSESPDRQAALDQLAQEQKRMNDLLQRAQQVSEQAESSEPLLSRQLYDSVRKVSQDDAKNVKDLRQQLLDQGMLTQSLNQRLQRSADKEGGAKSLELTTEMLNEGYLSQAGQASQRASEGINELKRGVERAAESIIGDDAEALKIARSELDTVTQQLERELAQAGGAPNSQPNQPNGGGRQPGQPGQPGQPAPSSDQRSADQRQANNGSGSTESSPSAENPNGSSGQPGKNSEQTRPGTQAGSNDRGQQIANNTPRGGQNRNGDPRSQDPNSPNRTGAQQGAPQPNNVTRNEPQQSNGQQPGGQQSGGQQAGGQPPGSQQAGGQRNGGQRNRNQLSGGDPRSPGQSDGQPSLSTMLDVNVGPNTNSDPTELGGGGGPGGGPILGNEFVQWSDRLRNVEELLDQPALRDAVANARERARLLRQDYKRDLKKPDWAVVQLQVLKPLFEVRSRVNEELARRDTKDPLVPIDRDPVPNRYAESVRRYYEELGKDK